jgi:hypothetical protein
VLRDELAKQGSHTVLSDLIKTSDGVFRRGDGQVVDEEDEDEMGELRDLACEIAALGPFPLKASPFTPDELRRRLPLEFEIEVEGNEWESACLPLARGCRRETILLHQVTDRQSEQADVGFGKVALCPPLLAIG